MVEESEDTQVPEKIIHTQENIANAHSLDDDWMDVDVIRDEVSWKMNDDWWSCAVESAQEEKTRSKSYETLPDEDNPLQEGKIDDGSTDGTLEVLKQLAPLTINRLRRNFGQNAAIHCGIKLAKGELIVTIDGDGQNDPTDIPRLIQHLYENNIDVVSGCTLKVYKAECFKGVSFYGETHRFIPALLEIKGFHVGEIEVKHRSRTGGKSKYNWTKAIKGLIDKINVWFWHKYAVRPLHLLGGVGGLSIPVGLVVAVVGIVFYIAGIRLFRYFLPTLSSLLLISGIQVFLFGLIVDILSRSYFTTSPDTPIVWKKLWRNSHEKN
ncbi:MAG: glycosyltransferase [Chloroflexota bacterium]|nr:glycosyltransferase [Chloroflexota bacterium]